MLTTSNKIYLTKHINICKYVYMITAAASDYVLMPVSIDAAAAVQPAIKTDTARL